MKEMTFKEFKTMVAVKLQLLRGCCQTASIKKKQIHESVEAFIKVVDDVQEKKQTISKEEI